MLVTFPTGIAAEATFHDDMDGSHPMLKLVHSDSFTLLAQHIDRSTQGLTGGVEVVQVQGPPGESAQIAFDLPPAPVIAELKLAAMVRCSRPGVQIAARVTLPRSINSSTGAPYEILLRGGTLGRGLANEKLVLDQLPKLLERQARVARLQTTDSIDERQAFVSQLVFLVPGGTGVTELGVDWIELYGIVMDRNVQPASAEGELFEGPVLPGLPDESTPPSSRPAEERLAESPVHRLIEWRGESFEYLARLGFNAVWLDEQPPPDQLARAEQLGLRLVCPPPDGESLTSQGIDEQWKPVVAWDLGKIIARDDLEHLQRLGRLIAQHDTNGARLTVMRCEQLSRKSSRATDAIVLSREILGTDVTLKDYVTWIGQRQRIARPGTPIWATIESEFGASRARQAAALAGARETAFCASYDQLTAMTAAAMSVRCRNFVFTSESSLEQTDPVTQQRARNLELINLRLHMLTPWLATGKVTGVGRCSNPGLSAMVFQAERSHLLIPITWSRDFRSQQSLHVEGPVTFVVPGVAEATDVYLITLSGTRRLRHERTTGGLQVFVDSLPPDGMIILTSDAQAFSQVSRYLRKTAARAAQLHRDAAAQRLADVLSAVGKLPSESNAAQMTTALVARANQSLAICDRDLKNGYKELAYTRASEVDKLLSQAEYMVRNSSGTNDVFPTPLEFHIGSFDEHERLQRTVSVAGGVQKVAGGDFENLAAVLQAGWRHQQLPLDGISTAVRLCPDLPYQGSYCLELSAQATNPAMPVTVVPTAPVWISSPPIEVEQGELVEISGYVRVEEELIGTVDGLQIIDSLGGRGMATRIKLAPNWQPFRIVRAVTSDEPLVVSVALSGLGRAFVDNITVRTLDASSVVANAGVSPPR